MDDIERTVDDDLARAVKAKIKQAAEWYSKPENEFALAVFVLTCCVMAKLDAPGLASLVAVPVAFAARDGYVVVTEARKAIPAPG